jgi:branched-chain amino acid transport system permease protein
MRATPRLTRTPADRRRGRRLGAWTEKRTLLIGVVQTFAVALDYSGVHALQLVGVDVGSEDFAYPLLSLTISQVAPILPYLFLVLILIFRPKGLLGTRED